MSPQNLPMTALRMVQARLTASVDAILEATIQVFAESRQKSA
jgi:hypothetical protein